MVKLNTLRRMAAEHAAGRRDPEAHAHLLDHAANLAELRALPPASRRVSASGSRSSRSGSTTTWRLDGGTLHGRSIYFDPYAAAAPPESDRQARARE